MEFKDILRQLRLANNLSQEDLGDKIGMKKSNISKYERGDLEPGIATIKQLALVFGVTTDYLLGQPSAASSKYGALNDWLPVIEKAVANGIKPEHVMQFIETQISLAKDIAKKKSH